MYMIRHDCEQRDFSIAVVCGKPRECIMSKLSEGSEMHLAVCYLSEEMFFLQSADRHKIIPSGIIMKICPYYFPIRKHHPFCFRDSTKASMWWSSLGMSIDWGQWTAHWPQPMQWLACRKPLRS